MPEEGEQRGDGECEDLGYKILRFPFLFLFSVQFLYRGEIFVMGKESLLHVAV